MSDKKDDKKQSTGKRTYENTPDRTVSIDDVLYNVADLSDEAKNQMVNVRVTDEEIQRLKHRMAIAQTARLAYAKALTDALPAPKAVSKSKAAPKKAKS